MENQSFDEPSTAEKLSAVGSVGVVICCINYNSANDVRLMVDSVRHQTAASETLMLVVDNSSNDKHYEDLRVALAGFGVVLLRPPGNLGYFGGAAWAFEVIERAGIAFDWFIVSNPDIRIADSAFFAKLLAHGQGVGDVIGPRISVSATGDDQNPFAIHRPSSAKMKAYRLLHSIYALSLLYQCAALIYRRIRGLFGVSLVVDPREGQQPRRVYAIHGSFMILSARYMNSAGLGFPGFLFLEEFYVAEKAREYSLPVVYFPMLEVVHNCHATTGRIKGPQMVRWLHNSTDKIIKAFFENEVR